MYFDFVQSLFGQKNQYVHPLALLNLLSIFVCLCVLAITNLFVLLSNNYR